MLDFSIHCTCNIIMSRVMIPLPFVVSVDGNDAPILIPVSVSVLFWWYRISIGKPTNGRY